MWTPIKLSKGKGLAISKVTWLRNQLRVRSIQRRVCGFLTVLLLFALGTVSAAQSLTLTSGNLHFSSDRGDSTLLYQALQLVREEQGYYQAIFGLSLHDPLSISFYYNPKAAGNRLHAVPYWSAGIARAGSEIHIYGRNRSQWLSTLRHELFHSLLGQNDVSIPVWLNEGLAQWHAGQMDWSAFVELGTATAQGHLIPLVDLDVILSFNHKRASLAYGQALDATQFLIKRQGASILPYLLRSEEVGFRERFQAETGEDLIDFEIAWRKNLEARFWFFKISSIPSVLWALSPLIVILAWFLKRRRGKLKLQEWEREQDPPEEPKYYA